MAMIADEGSNSLYYYIQPNAPNASAPTSNGFDWSRLLWWDNAYHWGQKVVPQIRENATAITKVAGGLATGMGVGTVLGLGALAFLAYKIFVGGKR